MMFGRRDEYPYLCECGLAAFFAQTIIIAGEQMPFSGCSECGGVATEEQCAVVKSKLEVA